MNYYVFTGKHSIGCVHFNERTFLIHNDISQQTDSKLALFYLVLIYRLKIPRLKAWKYTMLSSKP